MRTLLLAAAALLSGAAFTAPANAGPAFHPLTRDTGVVQAREAGEAARREDRQQDRRQDRQQDRHHGMTTTPGGFDASGVLLVREGGARRSRGRNG